MKKFFNYLQINFSFSLFIFFLCYLLTIKSRLVSFDRISLLFTPEAPIIGFISAIIIFLFIKISINYLKANTKNNELLLKDYLKYFFIAFVIYMILSNTLGLIVSLTFNTFDRNFNALVLLSSNITRSVDFVIFGSIYIAYLYQQENKEYYVKLNKLEKNRATNEIQRLKAQLNPHFLFNSLNTLDQLIEEDKDVASDFLNHFAELYRYSLDCSDKKLVQLEHEISFIKDYFKLMEHKYLGEYILILPEQTPIVYVPPFCLQILIENAIEHNMGSIKKPIQIEIMCSDKITVTNTVSEKKSRKKTSGRGLINLKNQFKLLCNEEMTISKSSEKFTVELPYLEMEKNV